MKKNIIITAGPTNERIDSVMKITNMSTGALGSIIADEILKEPELNMLFYFSPKLAYKPKIKSEKLKLITTESTADLLKSLKEILINYSIDGVIHSAAVGDYYGEYSITGELLAKQIASELANQTFSEEQIRKIVLKNIENPPATIDNDGKISSYEENLLVKLGLTPKIISHIKEYAPNTKLIGFKLLDGVSKEMLLEVATNLLKKNNADYIVANDLSKIGNGKHKAYIIDQQGNYEQCEKKEEIAKTIIKKLF